MYFKRRLTPEEKGVDRGGSEAQFPRPRRRMITMISRITITTINPMITIVVRGKLPVVAAFDTLGFSVVAGGMVIAGAVTGVTVPAGGVVAGAVEGTAYLTAPISVSAGKELVTSSQTSTFTLASVSRAIIA